MHSTPPCPGPRAMCVSPITSQWVSFRWFQVASTFVCACVGEGDMEPVPVKFLSPCPCQLKSLPTSLQPASANLPPQSLHCNHLATAIACLWLFAIISAQVQVQRLKPLSNGPVNTVRGWPSVPLVAACDRCCRPTHLVMDTLHTSDVPSPHSDQARHQSSYFQWIDCAL